MLNVRQQPRLLPHDEPISPIFEMQYLYGYQKGCGS